MRAAIHHIQTASKELSRLEAEVLRLEQRIQTAQRTLREATDTHPSRRSFKQRARKQIVELNPDKLYTPSEVAALLNVSYDTAVRRMLTMKGCVDMGTQTKRYKRGKRLLRINGKHLVAYIRSKTKEQL
jgi:Fic family protein